MTDIVFRNDSGVAVTTSVKVAEVFGKNHKNVMQAIDKLIASAEKSADVDNQEIRASFELSHYEVSMPGNNASTRKVPMYIMTERGYVHVVMGFTGDKARVFKNRFYNAFKMMEQTIKQGLQQVQTTSSINDNYLQNQRELIMQQTQMIQQQAQMIQQQAELCNSLMQRLDVLAQSKLMPEQQRAPILAQPAQSQSVSMDLYPREGVVSSYKTLRVLHPDFVTVDRASQLLHERGVRIHKRSLYTFLEKEDYLSTEERTYHRPSRECVESGWMVCTSSGGTERYPRRKYHTPHLSPEFLDILEERLRNIRMEKLITHNS